MLKSFLYARGLSKVSHISRTIFLLINKVGGGVAELIYEHLP